MEVRVLHNVLILVSCAILTTTDPAQVDDNHVDGDDDVDDGEESSLRMLRMLMVMMILPSSCRESTNNQWFQTNA